MNATARRRNQTQKGTNPVPVHPQKTHGTGIPAETTDSEGPGGEGQGVTADRQYVLRIRTNSILSVLNATKAGI